jgi:hypothetical protein
LQYSAVILCDGIEMNTTSDLVGTIEINSKPLANGLKALLLAWRGIIPCDI